MKDKGWTSGRVEVGGLGSSSWMQSQGGVRSGFHNVSRVREGLLWSG